MRLDRSFSIFLRVLLLCLAVGAANAQNCSVVISAVPSTLLPGQVSNLTASVSATACGTDKRVRWDFSPLTGAGTPGTPTDPDPQTGNSTDTYTAPNIILVSTKVTVTVTLLADLTKTASTTITMNPVIDVGTGAPTPSLQQAFLSSFYRNNFYNLVSLPPLANVKRLGSTGYVQEFNDAAKSGAKLALATASTAIPPLADGNFNTVVQMNADLYSYYSSVGANTAGLPFFDAIACPFTDSANSCTYDYFDKSYVLFAYHAALATGQNFTINGVYFTEWVKQQGITGLGRPVDVVTTVTLAFRLR